MNINELTKERRSFYYTGIVLICLAVIETINSISNILGGYLFADALTGMVEAENLLAFRIVVIVILMFTILVQVYLGLKAMAEAKKPSSTRIHIVLAGITCVVDVLVSIIVIFGLFGTGNVWDEILNLILCVVDVLLMFCYVREGMRVRVR